MSHIIFSARLSRILLKNGYIINDIAPNKENPDRSVFYFKDTLGIAESINEYISSQRLKKQELTNTRKK